VKQLLEYQNLLATTGVEWGLIGPREVDRLWDRHLDNCLAVTEDHQVLPITSSVIDVGTGAGLPGLVWAIARPDLTMTLVEPLERRVRFLELAVQELNLQSVTIVRGRAQDVQVKADIVTARAVSALKNLLAWLSPLVSDPGRMVLMKGQKAGQEIEQARSWLTKHDWHAEVREVGSPPRARVVVVERGAQG
jgi:16S rRNA (guanine527-N7)-methyltransferase